MITLPLAVISPLGSVTVAPLARAVPFLVQLQSTLPEVRLLVLVSYLMLVTVIWAALVLKGYSNALAADHTLVMSDVETVDSCATRSATLDATLVTSARHSSACDTSTTPKNSVIITGSSMANSTAASPLSLATPAQARKRLFFKGRATRAGACALRTRPGSRISSHLWWWYRARCGTPPRPSPDACCRPC